MRKVKITSLMISAFMITSLISVMAAAPVSAPEGEPTDITFQECGDGIVRWSTDKPRTGNYSMRLELPSPINNEDEARVRFDYNDTLNSLDTISFWACVTESFVVDEAGNWHVPMISWSMDRSGDGQADTWVIHVWTPWSDFDWHETTFDETCSTAATTIITGEPEGWIFEGREINFGELKTTADAVSGKNWGDLEVLQVKIGIGNCGESLEWAEDVDAHVIAFVDDVTINNVTYDLEMPTSTITLTPDVGVAATTVAGEGFNPNSTITIDWVDATPLTVPTVPAEVVTLADGSFTAIISVLDQDVPTEYTVTATDEFGLTASATFEVLDMKGETGDKGIKGNTGSSGSTGSTGSTGPTGPKGDEGDAGAKGDKGDTGSVGPKGDTGSAGPQGLAGEDVSGGIAWASMIVAIIALIAALYTIFKSK